MFPRTIQTVADELGIKPGTLRHYERLGLLRPARDSTNRRIYTEADVELARSIKERRFAARGSGLRNTSKLASV
jgi:DNA-binding transcriptional MerR regulator